MDTKTSEETIRKESSRHAQSCLTPGDKRGNSPARDVPKSTASSPRFSGIPVDRNSPLAGGKRDSGYLTDNSPAPLSHHAHFTFEEDNQIQEGAVGGRTRSISSDDIQRGELENSELLFMDDDEEGDDSPFMDEVDGLRDNMNEENERDSETVRRNEVLLNRQSSLPMAVPLSPPIANIAHMNGVSAPFLLPAVGTNDRRYNRTVATQTPHILSQMVHHVLTDPVMTLRVRGTGTAVSTLRHYSDSEDVRDLSHPQGPLPDIIPHLPRDRSISLPDMQTLRNQRELEVGRELRRLSDEFNQNYSHRRRRSNSVFEMVPSNSFPGAHRNYFTGFVDTFRSMFLRSPSPLDERDDPS
ncbi:hypothetical protein SNE40_010336 [Patella caerulea]|uniref:Uncharacterized protein n=1 Tax=Patella caerulea TaxID=87958 RepID=A0AAN8PUF5_PATCE